MHGILFCAAVLIILAVYAIFKKCYMWVTVFQYERGVKYKCGIQLGVLPPGQYLARLRTTRIEKIDMRQRFVTLPGQEVLSLDGISLKLSLAAQYEVADPAKALTTVQSYDSALYTQLQLALREVIASDPIDDVLEKRLTIGPRIQELTKGKAEALGLNLINVNLRDVMFPGSLKELFAQVVKARKEGQAALERARGETAALRNLANAARLLEQNPALMSLRALQAVGESEGSTLVFGMPQGTVPLPVRPSRASTPPPATPSKARARK